MPKEIGPDAKDTGMCPHGNFPATCKNCNEVGENTVTSVEEKVPKVESLGDGLRKIQSQVREMYQSFPPAKELADNYSFRVEKGYDIWAIEIGRLMTLRAELKMLIEDIDQRMNGRRSEDKYTDSTFILAGLDKIVDRLEGTIHDPNLRDIREQLTKDLFNKFRNLREIVSATQDIARKNP